MVMLFAMVHVNSHHSITSLAELTNANNRSEWETSKAIVSLDKALTLPYPTLPLLSLPYLTTHYLTLPYLAFPYRPLSYV